MNNNDIFEFLIILDYGPINKNFKETTRSKSSVYLQVIAS